jgi:hypothetical protein
MKPLAPSSHCAVKRSRGGHYERVLVEPFSTGVTWVQSNSVLLKKNVPKRGSPFLSKLNGDRLEEFPRTSYAI